MLDNVYGKEFLWAQKYRPRLIDECILSPTIKNSIKGMISRSGNVSHLLFVGPPGCGKTTLAYAIANELEADTLYINASMDAGIDTLRTKIQAFASTMSLSDAATKIVILDEADGSSQQFQNGLKGFLEQFSANCKFIFTANTKHKIIDPILSRVTVVEFGLENKEKTKLSALFFKRILQILDNEKIKYDQKVVAKLIEKNFPDFRKTLNELQHYSTSTAQEQCINSDVLVSSADSSGEQIEELIGFLHKKDFKSMRLWVSRNSDLDSVLIFRSIWRRACDGMMQPASLPALVMILADYGYKSSFALDQQINTTAALLETMTNCEWNDRSTVA